jgi:hypothetical protein
MIALATVPGGNRVEKVLLVVALLVLFWRAGGRKPDRYRSTCMQASRRTGTGSKDETSTYDLGHE